MRLNDDGAEAGPTSKTRRRYLPFHEVTEGMELAEPVQLADRHVLRFSLPAGHKLTEDNLHQMATHGAEFVCIAMPDTRSDAEIACDAAAAAARVVRNFEGADLSSPVLAALFERVLAYRSR